MNKITSLFLGCLIFAVFWMVWTPGPKIASDYHISENEILTSNITPYIWREIIVGDGLGEFTITTLWSHPIHTIFGAISLLGISFEIRTKLLAILILLGSFLSIKKLLNSINVGTRGEIIGSLFYLTNTFFVLIFDGGQLSLALSYAVFPAVIYYFLKIWKYETLKNKLWFSFYLLILSFLDIRLVFLIGIVIFIHFLLQIIFYLRFKQILKNYISIFIISFIVLFLSHFYWLLPAILTRMPSLPVGYSRQSQVDFLSLSTIGHSFFLQQPHWYKNVFGRISPLYIEFIFIPFLVFLPLFFRRKDFTLAFWYTVSLVGIFFSKGSQEPLSQVYSWLFNYLPGFSFFRDPIKFYFLISLSYSVLMAITVNHLVLLKFKKNIVNKLIGIIPLLIIMYLLFLIRPVFLGQMTGLLSKPIFEKEFKQLSDTLKSDPDFSRTLWIPTAAPLGHISFQHPPINAITIYQKRPFAIGVKGTYETFNFLREAPYMSEIFDVSGIGYIAYPFLDSQKDDVSFDNIRYFYTFSDQLSGLPWLSKVPDSKIPLLKVKSHQDRFFVAQNIWWVIGSDDIYNESTRSAKLKLSNNALIFAEEKAGLGKRLGELKNVKLILNKKNALDLAASLIDSYSLIAPAQQLDFAPSKSGWWKRESADLVSWRAFLQTKYGIDNLDFDLGGGWAIAEGKLKLDIKNANLSKGKILLARVLESTRSGNLKFYQNDNLIGSINTKKEGNNVRWFEVGQLLTDSQLSITSEGDINVINVLAYLDKNEWLDYQRKALDLKDKGSVTNFSKENIQQKPSSISYKQINPTKYIVKVQGLQSEALLIFSENFDNLWQINGKNSSFPIFSLLNGFRIEKDGEYIIEFSSQKYVYFGLVISAVTIFILTIFLVATNLPKSKI